MTFVFLKLLIMNDKMSDSVLAKLSAAEADLAAKEAMLAEQLGAIQAKRASLQSVLEIFDSDQSVDGDRNCISYECRQLRGGDLRYGC